MIWRKILINVLAIIGLLPVCQAGGTNPPQPPCCSYTHSRVVATYTPPSDGKTNPPTVGQRSDVHIYLGTIDVTGSTLNVGYPFCGAIFNAGGGDDEDVCVNSDNPEEYQAFAAPLKITWTGNFPSGRQDTTNLWQYIVNPEKDEAYMPYNASYTLTATVSEGTDQCNVTDGEKSATVTIKLTPDNSTKLSVNMYPGTVEPNWVYASQIMLNDDDGDDDKDTTKTILDYPACNALSKATVSYTISSASVPEGIVDDTDTTGRYVNIDTVLALPGNIKIVNKIYYYNSSHDRVEINGISYRPSNPMNCILKSGAAGYTLAHEWGHSRGNDDRRDNTHYIMYYSGVDTKNYIDRGENF